MNQNEQDNADAEDKQRNKEMAVGEDRSGLFKRSHRCGILLWLVRANITGARAALSSSSVVLNAEMACDEPAQPGAVRNERFHLPGIEFKAIR